MSFTVSSSALAAAVSATFPKSCATHGNIWVIILGNLSPGVAFSAALAPILQLYNNYTFQLLLESTKCLAEIDRPFYCVFTVIEPTSQMVLRFLLNRLVWCIEEMNISCRDRKMPQNETRYSRVRSQDLTNLFFIAKCWQRLPHVIIVTFGNVCNENAIVLSAFLCKTRAAGTQWLAACCSRCPALPGHWTFEKETY